MTKKYLNLQQAFELGALSGKNALTIDELCLYTGWKKSYVYKLNSLGKLRFSKPLGKTCYYDREWIDKFLLGKPSRTNDELQTLADDYINS